MYIYIYAAVLPGCLASQGLAPNQTIRPLLPSRAIAVAVAAVACEG